MRIAVDMGPLAGARTGVGNYVYSLVSELVRLAPEDAFAGLSVSRRRPDLGALAERVALRHVAVPARAMHLAWGLAGAPALERLVGEVDVYHGTNYVLPPAKRARRVLSIHDLSFLRAPELCNPKIVAPFSKAIRRFAFQADAILTCSESTRRETLDLLDVAPERVTVALDAAHDSVAPVPRDEAARTVAEQCSVTGPYLLFVGTLELRKNVDGILRAFGQLAADIPHTLLLLGSPGWGWESCAKIPAEAGLENRVCLPGYVPTSVLSALYSAADAFVFPSRYEGFGLPLLEAMRCGCPVVTSQTTSLPEVAGDAAVYVDAGGSIEHRGGHTAGDRGCRASRATGGAGPDPGGPVLVGSLRANHAGRVQEPGLAVRIGIDITPLTRARSGVGAYCFHMLREALALAPDDEFVGLTGGMRRLDLSGLPRPIRYRRLPAPTRALYAWWEATGRPRVDRLLGGVDVYHATNYFLPPCRDARRVLTVYDLAFLRRPEWCSPKVATLFAKTVGRFVDEADLVVTCSEHTKRDMVALLDTAPDKIRVAYGGVNPSFGPMDRAEAAARVARKYAIAAPFLLFVSTLEPRKNVAGLVRAFARVSGEISHSLVLVGAVGWKAEGIFEEIERTGLQSRITHVGFAEQADLRAFYGAADGFVFPSLYEGFGLPLLEAMACGCPAIAADNSSIPEVAGDAALLVEATDESAIAEAIRDLAGNESLRKYLADRGLRQARRFTWEAGARVILDAYRELASCS